MKIFLAEKVNNFTKLILSPFFQQQKSTQEYQ
jgi:hypothetical protein